MICRSCAVAADFASGRDGTPIEDGLGLENAAQLAAKLHGRCDGCDCQHRVREIRANLPAEVTDESMARFEEMIRNG